MNLINMTDLNKKKTKTMSTFIYSSFIYISMYELQKVRTSCTYNFILSKNHSVLTGLIETLNW